MNMTNNDFKTIEMALSLISGEIYSKLTPDKQDIIIKADIVMINLEKKKRESNKKSADYIKNKRKVDKNYARSKK